MNKDKSTYRPAVKPPEPLDEMVASILNEGERRLEEKKLSREERTRLIELRRKEEERKKKQREKSEARKGNRLSIDLPIVLNQQIKEIAQHEGTTISQVITFLLYEAIDRFVNKEISFWSHKYPSRSPRYKWNLIHPKDTERMEEHQEQEKRKW